MIYIGIPYTHPDKTVMEDRYKLVSSITAYLVKRGFIVFSPITYGHTLCEFEDMPRDFKFWNELCLSFLVTSDLLVCVKALGWEESRGLDAEMEFASENGISILDLELEDGEFNITELENSLEIFEEFGVLPAPKSEVKLPFKGKFSPHVTLYGFAMSQIEGLLSEDLSSMMDQKYIPLDSCVKEATNNCPTSQLLENSILNYVELSDHIHQKTYEAMDAEAGLDHTHSKNKPPKPTGTTSNPQPNFNNLMVVLDSVPNGNLQISLASFDLDLGIFGPNITMPLTNNSEAIRVADFMEDYEFIWSKSIKYDIPLLERVLESFDLDIPWVSENERCVNTFVHHMPHVAEECVFEGDTEEGFDICKHQINYCHLVHKLLTCNSNGRL